MAIKRVGGLLRGGKKKKRGPRSEVEAMCLQIRKEDPSKKQSSSYRKFATMKGKDLKRKKG